MAKKNETIKKKGENPDLNKEKELQKKYAEIFKKVVGAIQSEENAALVYQVLMDILMQLEQHARAQMSGGCGHDCSSCSDCSPKPKAKK
ncbi:MAG: hypothetical protein PHT91_01735 [Candidatus Nanoarchaeia archaeon]|nr:hypothetical protein [Candidatus Nanoarchaeia archaeon]MDD5054612.1 hypothetical protein [Candidatus Nanoarchaeia archaeon]MDD5499576.1 hypothetical protein [Candidatus Nanoarchaeia archaeon]